MKELVEEDNYGEDDYGEEAAEEEVGQVEYESTSTLDEEVSLTRAEAGRCLHTLGRCDSEYAYAYLGLDARDRGLTDVSVIPSFRHVVYVDVSGNKLASSALRVLETMTYLLTLQADGNCMTSAEMKPLPYLQVLTLNKNKLTDTSGIRHESLEHLELNHNGIRTVTLDPEALGNLRTLELRGNALTSTRGIRCASLARLFLADNRIETIEGLEALVNLQTLHLRDNKLANLNGFHERCRALSYVNLRGNELTRISELVKLARLPNLGTLVILENPLLEGEEIEEGVGEYRRVVLAMLPKLKRIDKDPVSDRQRDEAAELLRDMKRSGTSFADLDRRDEELRTDEYEPPDGILSV